MAKKLLNKESLKNTISTDELCKEYSWYETIFPEIIQQSFDEFFNHNFNLKFIGLSKNINCLIDKESCFVTKIKIDYEYDMFFRMTDCAVEIILNKILGQSKNKFNINKISDLEAKVITSFNDFLFGKLKPLIDSPPQNELKRTGFDMVHLTFLIKEVEEFNKKAGKVIITLPLSLVHPEKISAGESNFSENSFPESCTRAKVFVGKTKFSLYDIKHLENEDVVVFDDSNLDNMLLMINNEVMSIKLNPNMDLIITDTNNGGYGMGNSNKDLWDSIEVDMIAEFDSVKITLGELKDIEDGLVVDLASLYDNKVTLKVEDKPIASGSLVIVNDRYGVKIEDVFADKESTVVDDSNSEEESEETFEENEEEYEKNEEYSEENEEEEENQEGEEGEEEFDYSDFELEDENI